MESEAEHMSEFADEGYYDDLRFKEEFNNSRIWRRSSKKTNERKSDYMSSYKIVEKTTPL